MDPLLDSPSVGCLHQDSTISQKKIQQILQEIDKWYPKTTDVYREMMCKFLFASNPKKNTYIEYLLQRIEAWIDLDVETLVEVVLYYFIGIVFMISHYSTLRKLHGENVFEICESRTLRLSLVCVVVDRMVDHPDKETRERYIYEMKNLLLGVPVKNISPKSLCMFAIVESLLDEVPGSIEQMITSFNYESASVKQMEKELTMEEVLVLETKKGATTYQLLGVLLNDGESLDVPDELGLILQLYDDMLDIYEDREAGIHTIPTKQIDDCGYIDETVWMIYQSMGKLHNDYWPFKFMISMAISVFVSKSVHISPELTEALKEYCTLNFSLKTDQNVTIFKEVVAKIILASSEN